MIGDIRAVLGFLSGVLVLAAAASYIRSILRGESKPDRGANTIWMVTSTISFFAYWAGGAQDSVWFAAGDFVVAVIMLGLTLKYGYGWVRERHVPGLAVAFLGLVLWAWTDEPLIALVCSVTVDAVGSILVAIKAYEAPDTEHLGSWIIYGVGAALALVAIQELTFAVVFYPFYAALATLIIIAARQIGLAKGNKGTAAEKTRITERIP